MCTNLSDTSYLAELHTVPVLQLQMTLAMKIIHKEIRGVAVLSSK